MEKPILAPRGCTGVFAVLLISVFCILLDVSAQSGAPVLEFELHRLSPRCVAKKQRAPPRVHIPCGRREPAGKIFGVLATVLQTGAVCETRIGYD